MPSSLERIHHAIGDAGRAADGAGFAAALGAERIGAARRGIIQRHVDRRNVVGARHAVILVARGQQLAFLAVGDALIQRLPDALRDAAMHLAGHQHRIDGDADVVDRGVAHHLADAGFRIDLDLADMRAVRPARPVDLAFAVDAKPRAVFLLRDLEQADALVGADHRQPAVAIFDILDRGLQHVRGLLARLVDHVVGRDRDRRAADEQRARADAAETGGQIRVALHDVDLVHGNAERIRYHLRVGGLQPLPHRHGAGMQDDAAFRRRMQADLFGMRAPAGPFDVAGEAAAVEQALLLRRLLARGKAVPVRKLGGARQHVREGAGIVHLADRIGVGQLRGLDVVHLADGARVHADLPRGGIHQPLDDEHAPRAALRRDRRRPARCWSSPTSLRNAPAADRRRRSARTVRAPAG